MKKIQAKKKRDRADAEKTANEEELKLAAPHDGQVKSILDQEDDVPILFG